ncbi:MAG: hypothetical protein M5U34_47370 [Chloroflexi bacterium]|nr:hypothetical protein [Chloroflexota bacterium]
MWSGATSSFWANATLAAGDSIGWAEFWYPVHGMGGFTYANRSAALKLAETSSGADISVAVSGGITGEITLWVGGQQADAWPLTIYPGQTFRATWIRPTEREGGIGAKIGRERWRDYRSNWTCSLRITEILLRNHKGRYQL